MNPTARLGLLVGAFALLVFGVVCLKKRMAVESLPPAFVPGDTTTSSHFHSSPRPHEPMILSAEPGFEPPSVEGNQPRNLGASPLDVTPQPMFGSPPVPVGTTAPSPIPLGPTEPQASAPPFAPFPSTATPDEIASPIAQLGPPVPVRSAFDEPADAPTFDAPVSHASGSQAPMVDQIVPTRGTPVSALVPASFESQAAATTIVTTENDSWWSISERAYGRGDYYKALYLLNASVTGRPDRLAAGVTLDIPAEDQLRSQFPGACPVLALGPTPGE